MAGRWDQFISDSSFATFLHTRRFLSYHGSRFKDASVIIQSDDSEWLGVLPAAISLERSDQVVSHPGSTFGGIIHQGKLKGEKMLLALSEISSFYQKLQVKELWYKVVPSIYHPQPNEDDLWALFRLGAKLFRRDLASAVHLRCDVQISERRRRSIKKAEKASIKIIEGTEHLAAFWNLLDRHLVARHGRKPAHNLEEISELICRFPKNVLCMTAEDSSQILAGIVIFTSPKVWHLQYSMASDAGYLVSALDALLVHADKRAREAEVMYLDFGVSTTDQGLKLNDGLYTYKSEFGGGGFTYDHYRIDCSSPLPTIS
ncbi:MAG: methicillin resistance protein [Bacteriovoracaceae bacterium]|nr:methicillin resistance protein [Bacteriovoracaceae bacterium]